MIIINGVDIEARIRDLEVRNKELEEKNRILREELHELESHCAVHHSY